MMNYKYNENTLIHSIGFNFGRLESIFKYGILSCQKAKELGVPFARNYFGYNLDDMVSLIRYLYVNPMDKNSAYAKYTTSGISFLVEDVNYLYNKDERIINHSDEVLVHSHIPVQNIKGLLVPSAYRNVLLKDLDYLPLDSTSFLNIKNISDNLIRYLGEYGYEVDTSEYTEYILELYVTNKAISKIMDKDSLDYLELEGNFKEIIKDLNEFFQVEVFICFAKILNNKRVTVMDVVNYLNNKYHSFNIYDIPIYVRGKGLFND